jgi:hypothetical protein
MVAVYSMTLSASSRPEFIVHASTASSYVAVSGFPIFSAFCLSAPLSVVSNKLLHFRKSCMALRMLRINPTSLHFFLV